MFKMKRPSLSQKQSQQIKDFKEILVEGNKKINLFSRKNFEENLESLLEETIHASFLLNPVLKGFSEKVLDLGSGNGLPGLICGILYPETCFLLCERNRKKAEFLKGTIFKLKTDNVDVLCENAGDHALKFKKILSQATSSFKEILKVLDKVLDKKEGEAFLWKNPSWEKNWPKNSQFIPEIFKIYSVGRSEKILLKIRSFESIGST